MLESINNMLFNQNFIPHGHCYLWQRELVGLHLLSDLLIALAYYSIPALLVYFVYKRRDVPFSWIFLLFGAFIISCGTTHIMEVWTLWHPTYWLSGAIKAITALVSLYTAAELIPLIPKALALPSPAQLEAANLALTAEIAERQRAEAALHKANVELESRVEARTAELRESNKLLLNEIASRQQVEESLRETVETLHRTSSRFRRVIESNMIGMGFWDIDGNIAEANDALLKLTGYGREDFETGVLNWVEITPLEYRQLDKQAIQEILEIGYCNPFEKEYIRKDGSRIPILVGGAAFEETKDSGVFFVIDLTERKRVEESLRDALQKLTFHFENTPLAVVEWDSTFHRVCRWSPAAEKIFGWTAEEVLNLQQKDWNFVFAADAEAVSKNTAQLREGKESRNISPNRNYTKDGSVVYCEWYNSALYDATGSLVSVLSLVLDVTERYSFLEALRQSEGRFRIAAECASDLIYEWDINTGIVLWFGHIDEPLGYVKGQFPRTREGWIDSIHPDDRDRISMAAEKHLQTQEPFFEEYRIQQQDGAFLYWIDRGTVVRDNFGKAYKWIGVTSDISDRKQAEQGAHFLTEAIAVLASSLNYEATLQRLADLAVPQLADWCCVHLLETDGAIRLVAVAHPESEKVELMWEIEKRRPTVTEARHGVAKVLRTGESKIYADLPDALLEAVAPDPAALSLLREYDTLSAMCVPLIAHGRKLGVISLLSAESGRRYGRSDMDLAERLAHHAAIAIDNARLYWEAQEANRIKDEFLATLSHELRTPLNAILGWAQILQQKKLTQEKTDIALETIERNARLQVQMIEDLLDVSRILAGKISLKLRPVELLGIIEAGLNTLRPMAEAKGVQLLSFCDEGVGLIFADSNRLQQVIWNLLSNAIKFTPSGGRVEVRLRLWTGDRGDKFSSLPSPSPSVISYAEIQIIDTGIGISQKFLPYVFERFRQADSSTTRSYGGLGLGLAIVHYIVTLQGGTVHAESAGEGLGATFTIRLPLLEKTSEEVSSVDIATAKAVRG
ncbi:PAS domain S-box protein [Kamptonema sp. UHCC 0994]|uniref:PAS domain S-box protein n=1 Tax=Kamptonema sp. UHCC 0994 TaxID=3031329 RepID=UPI0023B9E312|nr:PAS domain S-box protein [Kamptonema sp. UHCC 0994]MDF0552776.1 PAS domain S-box protein [Kamptonema sp. UHCC 0994]